MITTVQKWGNSLGVRIPKPFAAGKNLREGTRIDMREEKDRLVIVPIKHPEFSLDNLLKGVTKANVHNEADFGESQGREAW